MRRSETASRTKRASAPSALTDAERLALVEQGFVLLEGVLDAEEFAAMRTAFEEEHAKRGDAGGDPSYRLRGTRHPDLAKAPAATFARAWAHPRVLDAVGLVIRAPFRIGSIAGRDPLPGFGAQALHSDWGGPASATAKAATTLTLLDDFTRENGPTRVVAGSHRSSGAVPKELSDPKRRHPGEILVCAPAGTALVFNARLWHSGTRNESGDRSRRAIQCSYVARSVRGIYELSIADADALPADARALVSSDV